MGPRSFLVELVESTREAIGAARRRRPLSDLKRQSADSEPARDFLGAIRADSSLLRPRLIGEIKRASPSKGLLRDSFNPETLATIYRDSGASALSVLTEERFFQGSLSHLSTARAAAAIPVLRKDFILDDYQLYEARTAGADAVLLIAAILDDVQLKDYRDLAEGLGMATLTEVHDETELARALAVGISLIGINNRNLSTFKTDVETTFRLIDEIPKGHTVVSESGISNPEEIRRLADAGVTAVLIGETFMKSEDVGAAIRRLWVAA